jgi:lysozyme
MHKRRELTVGALAAVVAPPAFGQVEAEPPSRKQLFAEFVQPFGLSESYNGPEQGKSLALPSLFKFPGEAQYDSILKKPRQNQIFGIDVSGWTSPNLPIVDLRYQWVRFVYAKASQGTTYKDKKFKAFWQKLGALQAADKPWRGAYHFLSASSSGKTQADAFVDVLSAEGGLQPGDMTPAVDLEWDIVTQGGADQWQGKGKDYILDSVLGCLNRIKERTNRTPALYTSKAWFSNQTLPLTSFDQLKEFPLWVADYRPKRQLEENPDYPGSTAPKLWQFADNAQLTNFTDGLDVSVFNGTEADFKKVFQIS